MVGWFGSSVLGFNLHVKHVHHVLESGNAHSVTAGCASIDSGKEWHLGKLVAPPSRFWVFCSACVPLNVIRSATNPQFLQGQRRARGPFLHASCSCSLSFSNARLQGSLKETSVNSLTSNFHQSNHKEEKPLRRYRKYVSENRTSMSTGEESPERQGKLQKRKGGLLHISESSSWKLPLYSSIGRVEKQQAVSLKAYYLQKEYEALDFGELEALPGGLLSSEKVHQDQWASIAFWHAFPLYVLWLKLQYPSKVIRYTLSNYLISKPDYGLSFPNADNQRYSRQSIKFYTGVDLLHDRSRTMHLWKSHHFLCTFSAFRETSQRVSYHISDCYEIFVSAASVQVSKMLPFLGIRLQRMSPPVRLKMGMRVWLARMERNYGPSFVFLVGAGYWLQGFRCFPWLAVNFYFKDRLQVDPGTLQFLQTTVSLPFLAKPVYGVISDAIYIGGAHRLPYLIIAGVLQAISWGSILVHPSARSSVALFTAMLTLSNVGAAVAEVANDALVAELGKRGGSGELQSFTWLSSAAGSLLGSMFASFVLNRVEFEVIFLVFLVLVISQSLNCIGLSEQSFGLDYMTTSQLGKGKLKTEKVEMLGLTTRVEKQRPRCNQRFLTKEKSMQIIDVEKCRDGNEKILGSIRHQISILWELVRNKEILHPLMWFMGSYAVIPSLGSSLFYYQSDFLKINSSFLGMAKMVGQLGLLAGSLVYNKVLKDIPLRKLVVSVQVLLCVCMLSDLVLVKRVNLKLGIPDEFYILGASAFVEAISQFKVLPFMVLLAKLCPAGCEGSLLAFSMSCLCLASLLSGYFGIALASFLHISPDNFTLLPLGIFIQSMAALLPIMWIGYLPDDTKCIVPKVTVETAH